jgi:hypothetical protein
LGKNGELEIQTDEANALTAFFKAKAADLLEKGLTIKQVNNLNTHFILTAKTVPTRFNSVRKNLPTISRIFYVPNWWKCCFNYESISLPGSRFTRHFHG